MACLESYCQQLFDGQVVWSMTRDKDGHRDYKITHLVKVDCTPGAAEGPAVVSQTPGLPIPGALWVVDGDSDVEAYCRRDMKVTPLIDKERTGYFLVEQLFSSRPEDKCYLRVGTGTGTGNPADDPLNEAPVISGSFVRYTEQADYDRNGLPLLTSSFEKIRGPVVEFDRNRPVVRITMNEATLNLDTLCNNIDNVNSVVLWGFPIRTVKLSNISWERKYYNGCECYFAITYEFDINTNTFDREVLDEGTKVLHGEWDKDTDTWNTTNIGAFGLGVTPDPNNPAHFIRYHDRFGNLSRVILNGAGEPATSIGTGVDLTDAGLIDIEYYEETDFVLNLGIPADLECPE